jgi:competence protein ComEC
MIIPVLIYTSNVFSFVFLISTVLVTPILGIMIFTGYVTAILSIFSIKVAFLTSGLFNLFIIIFNFIAEFSSNISFLKMTIATPNLIVIIVYYVIVFYLLLFYRKKHRKIALKILAFFTLVCVINKCVVGFNKGLKIYFIDVGQGDSCLIITEKNKTILIDGGGSETGSYDVGKKVLVPYLLDRNVTKIDYAVFTHFDSDHCQGLFSVMNELTVKNAIISEQGKISENYRRFVDLAIKRKVNVIKVKARG